MNTEHHDNNVISFKNEAKPLRFNDVSEECNKRT